MTSYQFSLCQKGGALHRCLSLNVVTDQEQSQYSSEEMYKRRARSWTGFLKKELKEGRGSSDSVMMLCQIQQGDTELKGNWMMFLKVKQSLCSTENHLHSFSIFQLIFPVIRPQSEHLYTQRRSPVCSLAHR